jgi:hypothetical protein
MWVQYNTKRPHSVLGSLPSAWQGWKHDLQERGFSEMFNEVIDIIDLTWDHIQRREDHWAIIDLVGKGGHIRTMPMPAWVKQTLDDWLSAAGITHGKIFRCVSRRDVVWEPSRAI